MSKASREEIREHVIELIMEKKYDSQKKLFDDLKYKKNIFTSEATLHRVINEGSNALKLDKDNDGNFILSEELKEEYNQKKLLKSLPRVNEGPLESSLLTLKVEIGHENLIAMDIESAFTEVIGTFTSRGLVCILIKHNDIKKVSDGIEKHLKKQEEFTKKN